MIQISQLKLPCGAGIGEAEKKAGKLLKLSKEEPIHVRILRHSVDARRKPELYDVYTLGIELKDGPQAEEKLVKRLKNDKIRFVIPEPYRTPDTEADAVQMNSRPVIVGFGPAGIFCALELAKQGYRPVVLERGRAMEERISNVAHFWKTGELDTSSNIQFGEGGAGTFSDGKLNTGVKDRCGRTDHVMNLFIEAGAPEDIRYEYHPHIGTDLLRSVIVAMRNRIIEHGGEIRFESEMTRLLIRDGRITGVTVKPASGEEYELRTETVILAPGHSARGTIRTLYAAGIPMTQKNFAVGYRVSHPQEIIDRCMYGVNDPSAMKKLGLTASSYKLTAKAVSGRGVYSFCMCPGGYIVNASSEEGRLAVNGMSDHARDSKRANSAIIMTVGSEEFGSDDALAGMRYQEMLEERAYRAADGRIPVEAFSCFEAGLERKGDSKEIRIMAEEEAEELCLKGRAAYADVHRILPEALARDFVEGMHGFERTIPGFTGVDAYVCGLESRTSSPVRILRDDTFQSTVRGLFPCGEGAGYAGGITSAAIDGIRVAETIKAHFLPMKEE